MRIGRALELGLCDPKFIACCGQLVLDGVRRVVDLLDASAKICFGLAALLVSLRAELLFLGKGGLSIC